MYRTAAANRDSSDWMKTVRSPSRISTETCFSTRSGISWSIKAGLLFVDFSTGDELQLTGEAKVILDSPEIAAFQGAERIWQFRARQVIYRPEGLPLRWSFEGGGASPNSLMTGDWQEAKKRLRAR